MMATMIAASVSFGLWMAGQGNRPVSDPTAAALDQARAALLAWAVNHYQKSGSGRARNPRAKVAALPCPDLGNSLYPGASAGVCARRHHASLGLLPWRSLATAPLLDGSGSCLWYWVSGDYKSSPYPKRLNALSPGGWALKDGELAYHKSLGAAELAGRERIAAVIIAPGRTLPGSARPAQGPDCSSVGHPRDYIEAIDWSRSPGAADPMGHHRISANPPGNDRMAFITHKQLWRAVLANANVARLLLEELPRSFAACVAQILITDPANPLSATVDSLWQDSRCSDLYDRRARDLNEHWGAGLSVKATATGAIVGLVPELRQAVPRFGLLPPGEFSLPDDPMQRVVSPQWYCVLAGEAVAQVCAPPQADEARPDPDA